MDNNKTQRMRNGNGNEKINITIMYNRTPKSWSKEMKIKLKNRENTCAKQKAFCLKKKGKKEEEITILPELNDTIRLTTTFLHH